VSGIGCGGLLQKRQHDLPEAGAGCNLEVSIYDSADIDRFCDGRFQGTY
jgi:hypothetical protein